MYLTSGISALTSRSRAQPESVPAVPQLDPAVHTFSAYLFSHNEKKLSRKVRLMSTRLRRQDALITSLRTQLAQQLTPSQMPTLLIQDEHGEDDEQDEREDEQTEEHDEEEDEEEAEESLLGSDVEAAPQHWPVRAAQCGDVDEVAARGRQQQGEVGSIRDSLIAELRQVQAERQALRNLSNLPLPPSAFTSPLTKQASSISDLLQAAQQQQQEGETGTASEEQEEAETNCQDDALDLQSTEAEAGQQVEGEGAEGQPGQTETQIGTVAPASPASAASTISASFNHKRRRSDDSEAGDEDDCGSDSLWKRVKDETVAAPIADIALSVQLQQQQQCVMQPVAQPEPFRPLHAFPSALASLPPAALPGGRLLTPYRALSARIDRQSIAQLAASPMRFAIPQL